jgi:hypothetical protein
MSNTSPMLSSWVDHDCQLFPISFCAARDFSSICPHIDRMPNCSNLKLLFTALAKRPRPSQRGIRLPSCMNTFGIGHGGPGAEKTFRHYRPRRSRKIGNTGKHLSCSSELRPSSGNGAAGVFVVNRSPHFSHSSE